MTARTRAALAAALALGLAGSPALARKKPDAAPLAPPSGTLVDHVAGLTPDGRGGIERFEAFLIDAQGRIAGVYHHGDKLPERVAYHLDGQGRVVVPGLIDAHGHVMATGFARMTLDLSAARSLDEALSRVAAWTAAHSDAPWILGSGWDQTRWGPDTLATAMPTAAALDRVTGGKPAWFIRADGQSGWANSAALAAANVNAATPDPVGGAILRMAGSKQPAGVLIGTAAALVEARAARPRPEDRDLALAEAQTALLAAGITTIADMGTTIEDWQTYRRAGDRGALRLRIVSYAAGIEAMTLIGGPRPTPWLYDDRLRMAGVQFTLDGALGTRAAWLKTAYADDTKTRGLAQLNETQLSNLMSRAAMDHFQVAVDATGDAANAAVLDSIDDLSATYKGDRRWRIEHAAVVAPADVARFGHYGVVVSMQPDNERDALAATRLGPERAKELDAWKSLAAAGAPLAFGSDTPAAAPRPFEGMAAAISRQGGEALPREAALAAYTAGAAWALFADDRLGRIAPGDRADFLFLDADPMLASPEQLRAVKVSETWVGGQRAWSAAQGSTVPKVEARPAGPTSTPGPAGPSR